MKTQSFISFFLLIFVVNALTIKIKSCSAQQFVLLKKYENKVFDKNIKTVMLYKSGMPLSDPIISLNTDEKLEMHFDNFSDSRKNYHYTLIHCNALWEPSSLSQYEYLKGHGSGQITNVESSFNTTYEYFHYSLTFPEEEIYPLVSGNYVIMVFEDYNMDKPVLLRQFYVTESLVNLEVTIKPPSGDGYYTHQEIEFSVNYENYSITYS